MRFLFLGLYQKLTKCNLVQVEHILGDDSFSQRNKWRWHSLTFWKFNSRNTCLKFLISCLIANHLLYSNWWECVSLCSSAAVMVQMFLRKHVIWSSADSQNGFSPVTRYHGRYNMGDKSAWRSQTWRNCTHPYVSKPNWGLNTGFQAQGFMHSKLNFFFYLVFSWIKLFQNEFTIMLNFVERFLRD